MLIEKLLLFLIGLSSGSIIAAGVFAFLAIIGIFPRLIGMTGTKKHIMACETMMIVGGIVGNLMDVFHVPQLPSELPLFAEQCLLIIWGTSIGFFVGSLVMSLAETLQTIPVLSRRIHVTVGIRYVIASVAIGKMTGSFVYFFNGFGC